MPGKMIRSNITNPYQFEKFIQPMKFKPTTDLVTGRAVWAVRGVLIACSIVPGLPDWVPGLTNPLTGLPDWDIGLIPWEVEVPCPAVPGFLSEVPGLATWDIICSVSSQNHL